MNPVLQIIHISDLHVGSSREVPPGVEVLVGRFPRGSRAGDSIREGIATHDDQARQAFLATLPELSRGGPTNEGAPRTILVDTGDLTTYGDAASLDFAWNVIASASDACDHRAVLYGNHDAWSGDQPLFTAQPELDRQRDWLRSTHFQVQHPPAPLIVPVDELDLEVQVYQLNSVLHGQLAAALALGRIGRDELWGGHHRQIDSQLSALGDLVRYHSTNADRVLRVLLSHHPIFSSTWTPWDVVSNASQVGASLQDLRFHLVLSGHTHEVSPSPGMLTESVERHWNEYGVVQFVSGTLLQRCGSGIATSSNRRNRCQRLMLLWDPEEEEVVVGREVLEWHPVASSPLFAPVPPGWELFALPI